MPVCPCGCHACQHTDSLSFRLQADALAGLLAHTALGTRLSAALGPAAYGLLASALMAPTVLLPDLESLSALGVVGVVAASAVGLVVRG